MVGLEHKTHMLRPDHRPLRGREAVERLPLEPHLSGCGLVQAPERMQEGAFAGAAGANDRHGFPRLDIRRNLPQHRQGPPPHVVGLGNCLRLYYECIAHHSTLAISYSCRKASTGSSRAARHAGISPAKVQIKTTDPATTSTSSGAVRDGISLSR